MMLIPFDPRAHIPALVAIWNDACGANLAITQRFIEYNTRASTGAMQAGRVAMRDDQAIGFVLASALPNDPQTSPRDLGWIDALAVARQFQKQGIGNGLLAWAESFLRAQGCTRARLGGGLRPFAPGLPVELNNEKFFRARGFIALAGSERVWDVARDLRDYAQNPKGLQRPFGFETRPAQPDDANALHEFFAREFPNRWRYEYEEFLRAHAPLTNYHLLITTRGIDGFARLTLENSERPIERFFPHALPRPWGQLGPIGISKDARGKGFGGALLDAALDYLRDQGVRGCVIDWTDLVDFYRKFGCKPYREYLMLLKSLTRKI
ncbi:MAG: GNAT family N-acetyltransferase [Chloroflexi bacterium]|nr:GNAT family N-acetyltransferase [Chloroflexota bacterium]